MDGKLTFDWADSVSHPIGRAKHDLTLSSIRSTFADGLNPHPRVSRPVAAYPKASNADEGCGDRWLEWEVNDLPKYAQKLDHSHAMGLPSSESHPSTCSGACPPQWLPVLLAASSPPPAPPSPPAPPCTVEML